MLGDLAGGGWVRYTPQSDGKVLWQAGVGIRYKQIALREKYYKITISILLIFD